MHNVHALCYATIGLLLTGACALESLESGPGAALGPDAASSSGGGGGGGGGGDQEFVDAQPTEACSMVDLVIAVDGSGSMTEELAAMRTVVFPAFAARLATIGQGLDDFRVGTLDACPDPANYHTRGAAGECSFSGGNVWIESDSPALDAEFACIGDIYLDDMNCSGSNDDEQPASAAAASLEEPYASGANAGFSREEALLVVVAITDEDEQPTAAAQSAGEVYQRLVATKGGDVRRMVFLGIGGGTDCEGQYGSADEAAKLHAITDLFIAEGRGVWWDLCVGRLEDGLEQAFAVIDSACDELPPVL